jgi:hypothetical protein
MIHCSSYFDSVKMFGNWSWICTCRSRRYWIYFDVLLFARKASESDYINLLFYCYNVQMELRWCIRGGEGVEFEEGLKGSALEDKSVSRPDKQEEIFAMVRS